MGVSNKDCITKLTSAMANFVKNKQLTPLNYDATWGGLVSSSDIKGNTVSCAVAFTIRSSSENLVVVQFRRKQHN